MKSYQRFQCIGHTDFKGLSNAVTNTHPLLPSMGTTRQKSSCRNRLQNGPRLLSRVKMGTPLGPAQRIAHNGSHAETGAFPSAITARLCAASETPFIPPCFYIHTFPGSLWPLTIGRREKVSEDATATLSPTIPHCVFQLRSQMAHVRFHE